MEENKIYLVQNKYWVMDGKNIFLLCSSDKTPMREELLPLRLGESRRSRMICPNCGHVYILDSTFETEKQNMERILKAKKYQKLEIIDIDGIHTPVLKKKVTSGDNKYFASVQINESKRGPQLVIYAGKKGYKAKTQIFITPETKKMSFDHNDIQPTEIFTKITAQFDNETTNVIGKTHND